MKDIPSDNSFSPQESGRASTTAARAALVVVRFQNKPKQENHQDARANEAGVFLNKLEDLAKIGKGRYHQGTDDQGAQRGQPTGSYLTGFRAIFVEKLIVYDRGYRW
jgi:hypothetical protein